MSATGGAEKTPRALGGWLILLVLNVVLLWVAALYLASVTLPLIRFEFGRPSASAAMIWPLLKYGPDLLIGVAMPIWVLVLFVRRSRIFPAVCLAFFACWLALGVFDYSVMIVSNRDAVALSAWFQPPALQQIALGFALNVAYLALWGIYLRRSARVANTFVR